MERKNAKMLVVLGIWIISANMVLADRNYTYSVTVGTGQGEYATINAAIEAIVQMGPPTAQDLGTIFIRPGTYVEQLNKCYLGKHNVPAHCDLIGLGDDPYDVVIQHGAYHNPSLMDCQNCDSYSCSPLEDIEIYAIACEGDNMLSNLRTYNYLNIGNYAQFVIKFKGDGILENCVIYTLHSPAVDCDGHLKIHDCSISGQFYSCVRANSTFDISYTTINHIQNRYWEGEFPIAISVSCSGIIDHVTIYGNILTNNDSVVTDYNGPKGIGAFLEEGEVVRIKNTTINITCNFYYTDNSHMHDFWIYGIYGYGNGLVIVDNCDVDIAGTECAPAPNNDKCVPFKIDGVYAKYGSIIEIAGTTDIDTVRNGSSQNGYAYDLHNEGGSIYVGPNVTYTTTNGSINDLVRAKNLRLDKNYTLIQDAIDDPCTITGDVIEISPRHHFESINFHNKAITVRSPNPNDWDTINAAIIDADGSGSVVTFNSGEGSSSILEGVTITGGNGSGYASGFGGGIYCGGSSPMIQWCNIHDNFAECRGGGICAWDHAYPTISHCIIHNNRVDDRRGGGICIGYESNPTARNCLLYGNTAPYGGAIFCDGGLVLTNCTVTANTASYDNSDGLYLEYDSNATIKNSIFWGNNSRAGIANNGTLTITYSDIQGGWNGDGNIQDNPKFASGTNDYHLASDSPCIGVGTETGVTWSYDIDGQPRISDISGEVNANSVVDMGSDEAHYGVHNVTKGTWHHGIQEAIGQADEQTANTIEVIPGTYMESIDFSGKPITLKSLNPDDWNTVNQTIIDADGATNVVYFSSGSDAILSGFTITGAASIGINFYDITSNASVDHCIIQGNGVYGIYSSNSSPSIKFNKIYSNGVEGIEFGGGTPTIINNWIYNNSYVGVYLSNVDSSSVIRNNTVVNNATDSIGWGIMVDGQAPSIRNCIIWGHDTEVTGFTPDYSCIEGWSGGGTDNITSDPCFVNVTQNDYHLKSYSLCIDAGNGSYPTEKDIDGQNRNYGINVDIGADETNFVCTTCLGDATGNSIINIADITAIVSMLTPRTVPPYSPPAYTIYSYEPEYNPCADANSDGKINLADITTIENWIAPLTPPQHIPAYTINCP